MQDLDSLDSEVQAASSAANSTPNNGRSRSRNTTIVPNMGIRKMKTTGKLNLNKQGLQTGRWTKQEHDDFLSALQEHGRNWTKIAECVKTRTSAQVTVDEFSSATTLTCN